MASKAKDASGRAAQLAASQAAAANAAKWDSSTKAGQYGPDSSSKLPVKYNAHNESSTVSKQAGECLKKNAQTLSAEKFCCPSEV